MLLKKSSIHANLIGYLAFIVTKEESLGDEHENNSRCKARN